MDVNLLLKGFAAGIAAGVPVGPIGLLCTQRILASGRMHGLVSGLGAATSDVIYSSIVAFGLTIVSDFLIKEQMWFRLFAGVFFCLLGVRAFLTKQVKTTALTDKLCHFNNYSSTLLLTLSNPITILILTGVFAGLGAVGPVLTWENACLLVAGVFLGSMFWWGLLCMFVGVFHGRFANDTHILIARIFGGILTAIGIIVIIIAVVQIT
jgi:threonine/homoserine/homoserine lactone efflux protein